MSEHFDEETIMRVADGDLPGDPHVRECAQCANAVISMLHVKRAVREAMPRFDVPGRLRARIADATDEHRRGPGRRTSWLLAAAAAVAVIMVMSGIGEIASRRTAARELVDLHATIIGGTTPIDVVSTDRHTVKPWFEGKVPFAVEIPDLTGTPFRLVGGRAVFWRGRPGAYLLFAKGAHRVSLFEFEEGPSIGRSDSMTTETWRRDGLVFVAVGDLPQSEMVLLRR